MSLITGNVKKGVRVSFSATLFMLCFVNIGHLLQNFKYRHTQIYTQQPAHVFFSKESRPIKLSSSYIFNLLPVSISCIRVWFEVFTLVNIRWQSFEIWRHLFWRGVARDLLLPSSKRRVFPSSKTLLPAQLSKYGHHILAPVLRLSLATSAERFLELLIKVPVCIYAGLPWILIWTSSRGGQKSRGVLGRTLNSPTRLGAAKHVYYKLLIFGIK